MESDDLNIIQLELKYCERCGGLWIRRMGCEDVYCAFCAIEVREFASGTRKRSSPRLPVNHKSEKTSTPKVVVICGETGNA
jgi:Zn-finger nucleic acid-binding protein